MKSLKCYLIHKKLQIYNIETALIVFYINNIFHFQFHLQNTVNSFLSLFDQHAVSFVMQILPPASKEVFKSMYEMYKKYHKFTGKL